MLKGSIVALVTPFDKHGRVDEDRLRFLVDWHIKHKTDAVLVCGTTGESATLSFPEHKRIIEVAVDYAKGRIPIVAGCGSNSTSEALDLTMFAKEKNADYALIITPYYNKPTQEGLFLHYKTIAEGVDIPIIIYNVPSRTGINILPETTARLYNECSNIVGIKEASGSLSQMAKLMTLVDNKFCLLSGDDAITLPILSIGGRGVISVVANIMPEKTHLLVRNFLDGNIEASRKIQLELHDLIKTLFIETNPIPVKTALNIMGIVEEVLRPPLCRMKKENLNKLKEVLVRYRLIK